MTEDRRKLIQQTAQEQIKKYANSIVPTDLDYVLKNEQIELRIVSESDINDFLSKYEYEADGQTEGVFLYGLSISESKKHTIIISREMYDKSAQRSRFTIAHELGHYFLHSHSLEGQLGNAKLRSSANPYSMSEKVEEIEANQFAAELLMPEAKVRKIKKIFDKALSFEDLVTLIAKTFDVSNSAAQTRLNSLSRE